MNPLNWPRTRPDTEVEKAFQAKKLALLKTLPVEQEHEAVRYADYAGADVHRKEMKEEARAACRTFGRKLLSTKKKTEFWFEDVTQDVLREARRLRLLQGRG